MSAPNPPKYRPTARDPKADIQHLDHERLLLEQTRHSRPARQMSAFDTSRQSRIWPPWLIERARLAVYALAGFGRAGVACGHSFIGPQCSAS
jgi:hypothetical protein